MMHIIHIVHDAYDADNTRTVVSVVQLSRSAPATMQRKCPTCVCVCVCVCVCIHTHTYMHACIHVYTHMYMIYIDLDTDIHIHVHLDFLNKRDHLILRQAPLMVIRVRVCDRKEGSQALRSQRNSKRQDTASTRALCASSKDLQRTYMAKETY